MCLAPEAYDKQKLLLSTDAGHFSLLRALHMADYITALNGMSSRTLTGLTAETRIRCTD